MGARVSACKFYAERGCVVSNTIPAVQLRKPSISASFAMFISSARQNCLGISAPNLIFYFPIKFVRPAELMWVSGS